MLARARTRRAGRDARERAQTSRLIYVRTLRGGWELDIATHSQHPQLRVAAQTAEARSGMGGTGLTT